MSVYLVWADRFTLAELELENSNLALFRRVLDRRDRWDLRRVQHRTRQGGLQNCRGLERAQAQEQALGQGPEPELGKVRGPERVEEHEGHEGVSCYGDVGGRHRRRSSHRHCHRSRHHRRHRRSSRRSRHHNRRLE